MKNLILAAFAATLIAPAAFASENLSLTPERQDAITAVMTEQGYDVRKIDVEDGMFEVYALKDGERFEIYLDAELNVVETKIED